MAWEVKQTHNSVQISAECARELTDQVRWAAWEDGSWAACEDPWAPVAIGKPGLLRFDGEAMEHIDYIRNGTFNGPFFEIMKKHKVNGEVHFLDTRRGDQWGHRFVDGEYKALKAKTIFVEK